MDGGGQRLKAFRRALEASGLDLQIVGLGPRGTSADHVASSLLHRVKRRLLPVPLRRRAEAELAGVDGGGPIVSLVPSANRWALRNNPTWLDYPDLWSDIAVNHSATVDPISSICNRGQGRLWAAREANEYALANALTVASWSDHMKIGRDSVWLPTPVIESLESLPNRRPSAPPDSGVVYGMIGNFDYPPNRDAYDRLIRQWLPALLPSAHRIVMRRAVSTFR